MWKKIGKWVLGILAVIAAMLGALLWKKKSEHTVQFENKGELFERKADEKRKESAEHIRGLSARSVVEQYGTVCDTIDEGRDRFVAGVKRVLDEKRGGGSD